jgi:eukaryotic-like serine/threonine-protein kinase
MTRYGAEAMHCPDENDLAAYARAELPPGDKRALDAHLEACAGCRSVVTELVRAEVAAAATPHGDAGGGDLPYAMTTPVSARGEADTSSLLGGARLGRYLILDLLGAGGMGEVYVAYDPELDRKVAIKLLHPALAETPAERARLAREAQAMARLSHPNVIHVYDVGTVGDEVFVTMEYVKGGTLRTWLAARTRTPAEILAAFVKAGQGLAAAHAAGLVHRDFKPDNVLVGADERILVTDFGLARALAGVPPAAASHPEVASLAASRATDATRTEAGAIVGTPAYMAPEQITGEETSERTDIYSFCVALHEALYGQRPYDGETLGELRAAILAGTPRPAPPVPGVRPEVRDAIARGLSRSPAERFATMGELLGKLAATKAPRRQWWLVAAAGAVLAAAVGVRATGRTDSPSSCEDPALASVWDAEKKDAVGKAFLATGKPYARAAWERVAQMGNAYVETLGAARKDVCVKARAHGRKETHDPALELRAACLEHRRAELGVVVQLFTAATAQMVENADRAVGALPSIEACEAGRLLASPLAPPPLAIAARVEELRLDLTRSRTLLETGNQKDALTLARASMEAAEKLGYRPLEAEARLVLGHALSWGSSLDEAARALEDAFLLGQAARHDDVAIAAALAGIWHAAERQTKYSEAHRWARLAEATMDRAGRAPADVARYEYYVGVLDAREAHPKEARAHLEASLRLYEGLPQQNEAAIVNLLTGLGLSARQRGDYPEAQATYARALDKALATLGPDHPRVALLYNNQCSLLDQVGRHTSALAACEKAIALYERAVAADSPDIARPLTNLGVVNLALGRVPAAEAATRRAIAVRTKLSPEHPSLISSLENLALVQERQGKLAEALETSERAIAIGVKALGPDRPELASAYGGLGKSRAALKKHATALEALRRALALHERAVGPQHHALAEVLVPIAASELALGHKDEAVRALERAIALHEGMPNDPSKLARARLALARIVRDAEPARAATLAASAREAFAQAEPPDDAGAADVAAWLAAR